MTFQGTWACGPESCQWPALVLIMEGKSIPGDGFVSEPKGGQRLSILEKLGGEMQKRVSLGESLHGPEPALCLLSLQPRRGARHSGRFIKHNLYPQPLPVWHWLGAKVLGT